MGGRPGRGYLVSAGFEHMRGAFEVGDKLNDLSANTGVAVAELVVLQQEIINGGKSAEDIAPVFAKMAKSIHGEAAGGHDPKARVRPRRPEAQDARRAVPGAGSRHQQRERPVAAGGDGEGRLRTLRSGAAFRFHLQWIR